MRTKNGTPIPVDLADVLRADPRALAVFNGMRPSCQEGYVTWVEEAKRPGTRERRLAKVGERVLEYGSRHPERTGRA